MAGPYKLTLHCTTVNRAGMRTLHGYIGANQALDTYLNCDASRPAKSTDLQFIKLDENVDVIDAVCDSATGAVEIFSDGKPTGVMLDAATLGATNSGRPKMKIPLGANKTYSFYVRTVFPA